MCARTTRWSAPGWVGQTFPSTSFATTYRPVASSPSAPRRGVKLRPASTFPLYFEATRLSGRPAGGSLAGSAISACATPRQRRPCRLPPPPLALLRGLARDGLDEVRREPPHQGGAVEPFLDRRAAV